MNTTKLKTFDMDKDKPALSLEVIADCLTADRATADRLCERARMHWRTNDGFRASYKRKDERAVTRMWFRHWLESWEKEAPRASTVTLPYA